MNDKGLEALLDRVENQQIDFEEALKIIESQSSITVSNDEDDHNIIQETYSYEEPYLKDHIVFDKRILLGVTHGSLAINLFFKLFPQEDYVHLHRLHFVKPVVVDKDQAVCVQVDSTQNGSDINIQSMYRYNVTENWNLSATGCLKKSSSENLTSIGKKVDLEMVKASLKELDDLSVIYKSNLIIKLGESYKTITHLCVGEKQVLAKVELGQIQGLENHYYDLHPLLINSAFLAVSSLTKGLNIEEGFLPFGINDIHLKKTSAIEKCRLHVRLVKKSDELILFDADLINDDLDIVAQYLGCSLKRIRSASNSPKAVSDNTDSQHNLTLHHNKDVSDLDNKIQKYLIGELSKCLGGNMRVTDLEANLMDLGLESSKLVAMTDQIQQDLQIELNPTLLFEYPNIKELAEFFKQDHSDSFIKLFGIAPEFSENVNQFSDSIPSTLVEEENFQIVVEDLPAEPSVEKIEFIDTDRDDFAVIGMGGRFAGASDIDEFWNNLCTKKDLMKEIPEDHWDYRPWFDEDMTAQDKTYCKWGSFIDDVDKFDADFFKISRREAEWMDPQIRLMLQCIYATGEDAGYINQMRGSDTGVFVGVCFHDYAEKISELNLPVDPYMGTGNSQTVVANRASFQFDFTGPSVAVDTACSSSLFALHNACQALRNRECGMAFVGGVNLLLSSFHYRYFSSIGALSPTGRCHSFDAAADGYAPGECVAGILLKPLSKAIEDNDKIHAVIKGSAALHGGYTPSLTAPSVSGEENVIIKAWDNAGINPETISFIETHGTGTKLGDPIEISALKKAFKRFTQNENFCAVGTAKANIGHAEGAAGIAGIIKVILQMKHKKIPCMPKFQTLNPYIQLDKSPLYINQEMKDWKTPDNIPLRAGVSSFGFSGAYAHVVIEEYVKEATKIDYQANSDAPQIFVLSAKNEERLKQYAGNIVAFLEQSDSVYESTEFNKDLLQTNFQKEDINRQLDLSDITYTFQIGREPMEERLAFIVRSVEELLNKLKAFVEGDNVFDDLYRGQVKRNEETLALFAADDDLQKAVESWITKGKYGKLLDLWVKGLEFDWNKLYGEIKPHRISLPTYPFANERYWIPDSGIENKALNENGKSAKLHPLLHQNTSDFEEQRFSSIFGGQEFFLSDHVIMGQRVLPGVAYLEMARAAVMKALGRGDSQSEILLKNIVWVKPVIVDDQPEKIHIGLYPEESGEIVYEIYSDSKNTDKEIIVHSQGVAQINLITENPALNIQSLKAACDEKTLSSDQCYEMFKTIGLEYGSGHQGIETVYVGQEQVLAKLLLPPSVAETEQDFILHPSLMDSALQAIIVLMADENGDSSRTAIPFALNELTVFNTCTSSMWAFIKHSEGSSVEDMVQKFDIDLCDDSGSVCIRMKGFSSRVLHGEDEKLIKTMDSLADFEVNLLLEALLQQPDELFMVDPLSNKDVDKLLEKFMSGATINEK